MHFPAPKKTPEEYETEILVTTSEDTTVKVLSCMLMYSENQWQRGRDERREGQESEG
jgi:hypothetical protein